MNRVEDGSGEFRDRVERAGRGDRQARDELIASSVDRLERLTRKMLRDFPGVRRWEETVDVTQNALIRLCRALESVTPPTPADFFRLAAAQVRRELIDLSRHHSGPMGFGGNHASVDGDGTDPIAGSPDPGQSTCSPERMAAWTEFHERAGSLPEDERAVFDVLFYQGMDQAAAAEVLNISERTVKRRWQAARLRLHQAMGGRMPGL